jgi:hypothetical protein
VGLLEIFQSEKRFRRRKSFKSTALGHRGGQQGRTLSLKNTKKSVGTATNHLKTSRPNIPQTMENVQHIVRTMQCFSKLSESRTTSQAVGAHADRLRKILHTQNSMQVNRRNIIPVVTLALTTYFPYTNLKYFRK